MKCDYTPFNSWKCDHMMYDMFNVFVVQGDKLRTCSCLSGAEHERSRWTCWHSCSGWIGGFASNMLSTSRKKHIAMTICKNHEEDERWSKGSCSLLLCCAVGEMVRHVLWVFSWGSSQALSSVFQRAMWLELTGRKQISSTVWASLKVCSLMFFATF